MELTNSLKSLFIETVQSLKGSARRLFMARTVKELGPGGQRRAERDLGWSRMTIRKGTHELTSGVTCLDAFAAHTSVYPFDCGGSAPATHRPQRLYRRRVADRANNHGQIERPWLLSQEGREESAPKKIPETEAIFTQVTAINQAAEAADNV